jgi:uncharacterized protein involved in type VI secretion and phage assembly
MQYIAQPYLKINGSDIEQSVMGNLVSVDVDLSVDMPSMFGLEFHDDALEYANGTLFELGKTVQIEFMDHAGAKKVLMTGKISAIEPSFDADGDTRLRIRGYDGSHFLHQQRNVETFNNMSDSDIVSQIASANGMSAMVDSTSTVHDQVFQDNQTNFEFLKERARRSGRWFHADAQKLYFKKSDATMGAGPTLAYGSTLRAFAPRVSTTWQHAEVEVRGWDPKEKKEIVGRAASPTFSNKGGQSRNGGSAMTSAFSRTKLLVHEYGVTSQAEADAAALALLNESEAGFVQGDGLALGTPALKAGWTVELQKLGTRFSGKYFVTRARHHYTAGESYMTEFSVAGLAPDTLADVMLSGAGVPGTSAGSGRWNGVVTAIVTNNDDPEKQGRLKLKFPWLDDSKESWWARLATPLAGNERGLFLLPQVNDEVLVAFEHGDFNRPYVIGSLWNGKDAPPAEAAAAADGSRHQVHQLKTQAGSYLLFDDISGEEKIQIMTSDGHTILIDKTNKKIEVKTAAGSSVLMDDQAKKVEVSEPSGLKVTLDGNARKLTATSPGDIEMSATGSLKLKANGTLDVNASGPVTIKGAVVNIN